MSRYRYSDLMHRAACSIYAQPLTIAIATLFTEMMFLESHSLIYARSTLAIYDLGLMRSDFDIVKLPPGAPDLQHWSEDSR